MKKFKFFGLVGIDVLIIVLLFKVSPVLSIIVSGLLGFVIGLVIAGAVCQHAGKQLGVDIKQYIKNTGDKGEINNNQNNNL